MTYRLRLPPSLTGSPLPGSGNTGNGCAPWAADTGWGSRPGGADDLAPDEAPSTVSCAVVELVPETVVEACDLDRVADAVSGARLVGLDVETTGLDPVRDRPRLLQLATPDGKIFVIDLFRTGGLGPVAPSLERARVVGHNLQFDLAFLSQHFGVMPLKCSDTMTAARLLDGGIRMEKGHYSLAEVCRRELHVTLPKELQRSDWSRELSREQIDYAARDVAFLLPLRERLARALHGATLDRVARLEGALAPVVVEIELAGVGFNEGAWSALVAGRRDEAERIAKELQSELDITNLDSHKQLLAALRRRGLDVRKTSAEALGPYQSDPVVSRLARVRKLQSFVRGIGSAVLEVLAPHGDGRVRAHFDPLAAPTGRFGCSGPNLMALEKNDEVRRCVVPQAGQVFVVADYAAIELRVLADITQDPELVRIFSEGGDPHRQTAAAILGVKVASVSPADRQRAKAVNFGFAFGMGAQRFVVYAQSDYGVVLSEAEARGFKRRYLETYRGVALWQNRAKAQMPLVVRTASGRRRSFQTKGRGFCERLNTPVQGTAADGLKQAMILLRDRLRPLGARIVLCVHDEIVVEVPEHQAQQGLSLVEACMREGMAEFVKTVPIVVEAEIRRTWAKGCS